MAEYTIDKFSYGGNTYNIDKDAFIITAEIDPNSYDENSGYTLINFNKTGQEIMDAITANKLIYFSDNYFLRVPILVTSITDNIGEYTLTFENFGVSDYSGGLLSSHRTISNITVSSLSITGQIISLYGDVGASIADVVWTATCSTAGATADKNAYIVGSGTYTEFSGVVVFVTFSNTNSASVTNLCMRITAWHDIKCLINNVVSNLPSADCIKAGNTYRFTFDGTYWIMDINTDNDSKVNVTLGTTTKSYLLGTSTTPTSTATAVTAIADTGVYLDTTAGRLTATSFSGSGAALTSINASNISSGTLATARLNTSGVTAGSYGPSADAAPAAGANFSVPYVTVDTYGRVTSAVTRNITMPTGGATVQIVDWTVS